MTTEYFINGKCVYASNERRKIRDVSHHDYKHPHIANRDRQLAWLDKVAAIGYGAVDEDLMDFAAEGEHEVIDMITRGRI